MSPFALALRSLRRMPFVTAMAVLSLGLGIGANSAIFSMVRLVLLRSLPVPSPDALVNFAAPGPHDGSTSCNQAGTCDELFSYPMFRGLEKAAAGFAGLAAHRLIGANVAIAGQPAIDAEGLLVSGSYFPTLGVRASVGRLLDVNDDRIIGGHPVVVLDHAFWETRLGRDTTIVGRTLSVNGRPMAVVGIAPADFAGTTFGVRPAVYVPLTMRGAVNPGFTAFERRNDYWLYVFGRLRQNETAEHASAAVNATYHAILRDVEAPLHPGLSAQMLERFKTKSILVRDGRRGQSAQAASAIGPLALLLGVAAIVLATACVNIANLLLARAADRRGDVAVRLALGATHEHIAVECLMESLLLAAGGGIAGALIAHWTLHALTGLLPAGAAIAFALDPASLAFTAVVTLATGFAFGLVPAVRAAGANPVDALRDASVVVAGGHRASWTRRALATAQIALSMALLVLSAVFVRSLRNALTTDVGIHTDDMSTFVLSPILAGYDPTGAKALYARAESEFAAIPGVTAVTGSVVPLLSGASSNLTVAIEGVERTPGANMTTRYNAVGPEYFHGMGIPLVAGRDFGASDHESAPRVAVINEAFAERFQLGRTAVGRRVSIGNDSALIEIVGIARAAKYVDIKEPEPPLIVVPYRQVPRVGSYNFFIRSALPADQLFRAIVAATQRLDSNVPVRGFRTISQQIRDDLVVDRMVGVLCVAFGALATVLAAVGLYGVLMYAITQRRREIGVRMALGATTGEIRAMVLREVGRVTAVGAVAGLVAAIAIARAARSLLYQLEPYDPPSILAAAAVIVVVAFSVGIVPASIAARTAPASTLREL